MTAFACQPRILLSALPPDIPLPRLPNRDFVTYVDWQSLGWCKTCVLGMVNMWRIRRKEIWRDLDELFEVNKVN